MSKNRMPFSLAVALSLGAIASLSPLPALGAGPTYGGLEVAGNFALPSPFPQRGYFGSAAAAGDFDGDGSIDLAVGASGDETSGDFAGRVDLFLSGQGALVVADHFYGDPESQLGSAMVAGDFDGDGVDELAVGAPTQWIDAPGAGGVLVLEWNAAVATLEVAAVLYQGMTLLGETQEDEDEFGSALAVGDFNGDHFDDLAVGVPYEDLGASGSDHGLVHVFYGFSTGLSAFGSQTWTQDSNLVLGVAATSDWFGYSLAAGDFDGDGKDDLAIGVPNDAPTIIAGGSTQVLYGSSAGLTAGGNQLFSEDSPGVPGNAATNEHFGLAIAAGDFDGDGFCDLAVGAPNETVQGLAQAGVVYSLRGGPAGVSGTGSHLWTALNAGGAPAAGDHFGWVLAVGSFDGGRQTDLAITARDSAAGAATQAGAVHMMLGSDLGLSSAGSARFVADGLAVGPAQSSERFGASLAPGDFDGDGDDDLAIGVPAYLVTRGTIQVLRGNPRIFADGFELGTALGWSSVVP